MLSIQKNELVEILIDKDNGEKSIGEKRNALLERATGEYVCFFDDDDIPSNDYIERVFDGINKCVDCCSLMGIIRIDNGSPEIFEHSIKYKEWKTNSTGNIKYERTINHLNVIKSSIAKQFKFKEINHGEDRIWSEDIFKSGLIKSEHYINKVIYNYIYISNK